MCCLFIHIFSEFISQYLLDWCFPEHTSHATASPAETPDTSSSEQQTDTDLQSNNSQTVDNTMETHGSTGMKFTPKPPPPAAQAAVKMPGYMNSAVKSSVEKSMELLRQRRISQLRVDSVLGGSGSNDNTADNQVISISVYMYPSAQLTKVLN